MACQRKNSRGCSLRGQTGAPNPAPRSRGLRRSAGCPTFPRFWETWVSMKAPHLPKKRADVGHPAFRIAAGTIARATRCRLRLGARRSLASLGIRCLFLRRRLARGGWDDREDSHHEKRLPHTIYFTPEACVLFFKRASKALGDMGSTDSPAIPRNQQLRDQNPISPNDPMILKDLPAKSDWKGI